MKNIASGLLVLFFEFKANRLRPAIITYLHNQKSYWQQTLDKFHSNDKVTTLVHHSEEEIQQNINNIENELSLENKYQLLKTTYRNDRKMLLSIASDYCAFWPCLDFFRSTSGLNAADPAYAKTAQEFGYKKQQIYTRFENLLST